MPIESHFRQILEFLGEDPQREGLRKTPARAAATLRELCSGYQQTLDAIVNGALFTAETDDLVIVKNIELFSLCEHHMLPFIGRCHVGYQPDKQVIGLSKIARIVDLYARRLQIQEGLTREIAVALESVLSPKGVAVVIEAEHLCVRMQGVQKQNAQMVTSVMLGSLKENPSLRTEFMSLIKS